MNDETEEIRRLASATLNAQAGFRGDLEARYGPVWSTTELQASFDVLGFLAPVVVVRRKADGQLGSMLFQAHPRYYFCFTPDTKEDVR